MATDPVELRPRSTGEIFALAFDLYRKHFPLFVAIMAVVLLPILVLNALSAIASLAVVAAVPGLAPDPAGEDFASGGLFIASNCSSGLVLLMGILWPWAEGALTFNVIERVLGRAPGLRASYGQTRRNWASLWIANLLAQIGIGLPLVLVYLGLGGALLLTFGLAFAGDLATSDVSPLLAILLATLCVPVVVGALVVSILLAINWAFRAPAIVGEGVDGIRGLGRSLEIARGDRWLIFRRYILLFVLEFVVLVLPSFVLSTALLIGAFSLEPEMALSDLDFDVAVMPAIVAASVAAIAIGFVGTLLLVPFRVVFTTLNYLDLRVRKENLAVLLSGAAARPSDEATSRAPAPPAGEVRPPSPPPPAPHIPQHGTRWSDVDLARLTPGQRVGVLFNRIRTEGEDAQLLSGLALALMEIGDWGGALDSLKRAHTIAPHDPDVVYNLMMVYRERRNMAAARQMMQEYLRLEANPDKLSAVRSDPRLRDLLPND